MRKLKEKNPFTSTDKQVTQVNAPVATAAITRRAETKPVEISMTEEVSGVVVGPDFANSALIINPGNHELFPWLSRIAAAFTSYWFKMLRFRYVAATETGLGGDVIMTVNADPDKPAFSSEKQALNHEGAALGAPWVPFSINGKSKTTQNVIPQKFVADTASDEGLTTIFDDLHTVADGVLNVVTAGLNLFTVDAEVRARLKKLVVDKRIVSPDQKDIPTDDPPTETGKLFVDYVCVLSDPADDEEKEDDGYNCNIGPADATNSYGCAAMRTQTPAVDSDVWTGSTHFPQPSNNPVHVTYTQTVSGLPQTWLKFRDNGLYELTYFVYASGNPFVEGNSAYTPSIGAGPDAKATFYSDEKDEHMFGDLAPHAITKNSLVPTVTCGYASIHLFVEITGDPVADAGQVYIQDANTLYIPNANYSENNCSLVISRVAHDLTPLRLANFARKKLKFSLPDCPINAALMHLREERRVSARNSLNLGLTKKLRPPPIVIASAKPLSVSTNDQKSTDEGYFSTPSGVTSGSKTKK